MQTVLPRYIFKIEFKIEEYIDQTIDSRAKFKYSVSCLLNLFISLLLRTPSCIDYVSNYMTKYLQFLVYDFVELDCKLYIRYRRIKRSYDRHTRFVYIDVESHLLNLSDFLGSYRRNITDEGSRLRSIREYERRSRICILTVILINIAR